MKKSDQAFLETPLNKSPALTGLSLIWMLMRYTHLRTKDLVGRLD
jgi:hypothetical protein